LSLLYIKKQTRNWSYDAIRARVDFPLQCYFELNRRGPTITVIEVRERHADGRTAANMLYLITIVTNVKSMQKRKSPLASLQWTCAFLVIYNNELKEREKKASMHIHIIVWHAKQLIFKLSWILLWFKRKCHAIHWIVFSSFQILIMRLRRGKHRRLENDRETRKKEEEKNKIE